MSFIQIACAVLVPLLWGYQFVAIKVGVVQFPPLFFLGLRFLAIALLLIPFVRRPTHREFGPIAVISVFLGGLNFGLFYVGMGLGSGSMSAVAYQLNTPFTVLLAWPLLAERPSLMTSAGVLLASAAWSRWQPGRAYPQMLYRSCWWSGQLSRSRSPTS
jgi:O-acetylserine/cysteine efflux transporter